MPSLFSSPSALNDLLSNLQDISIEDELPRSPSPRCPHSDVWSNTEQDLAQTQLERPGQTYDSESEYAVQHIIFFNSSSSTDQDTSIADDSDHPHAEFLRYFGVLKAPYSNTTKYAPTPENSPEVDLSSGQMMYGLSINEPALAHRDGEVNIFNLSSRSEGNINDDNGAHRDHVGQVSPISPDAPPTTGTPVLHGRHVILPSATRPMKDVGPTSHIPSATSVNPVDPHETSKILPSSIAGFGQVIETTRVQRKRPVPVPVFSPETTKTFATTRRRRAMHPLEEPCPPLTPLALTPKLGQPQACSSPFGGAVLFGT